MKQPFWLAIWVIVIESIIVTVLIPGSWTERVIEQESELLEIRLGREEHEWVHGRARRWFNKTLIESEVYSSVYVHLIPTETQRLKSTGMEQMGSVWFRWTEGRLQGIANTYYQILVRYALLLSWLPYFLILLVPALFDGIASWRIKRTNFSYVSPLLHRYCTKGLGYIFVGLVAIFMAPIVLDPTIIPVCIMVVCVMAGLMVGNQQKRM